MDFISVNDEYEKWFANENYHISFFCKSPDTSFENKCLAFLKNNKFQEVSVKITSNAVGYVKAHKNNLGYKMKYSNSYGLWKRYDVFIACVELFANLDLYKLTSTDSQLEKHFSEYGYRINAAQKAKADNYDILTVYFDSQYGKETVQFYTTMFLAENDKLQTDKKQPAEEHSFISVCTNRLIGYGMKVLDIATTPQKKSITALVSKNEIKYRIYIFFYDSCLNDTVTQDAVESMLDFYLTLEELTPHNITERILTHFTETNFKEIDTMVLDKNTIKVLSKKNNKKYATKYYFENLAIKEFTINSIPNTSPPKIKGDGEPEKDRFSEFDTMDGHQFEYFCARLLEKNGYENVSVTSGSGDQGVDIIAYRDGIKYGIQCKCYSSTIGNRAVQEVFAGKAFYQCHVGVVLTNNYFTDSAKKLAESNGIILWNRDKLMQMIQTVH